MEKINIAFYLNSIEFTNELQKSLENGDVDINNIYIVFSKDRNGTLYLVGIEGSDEIRIVETKQIRGSQKWVLGFK